MHSTLKQAYDLGFTDACRTRRVSAKGFKQAQATNAPPLIPEATLTDVAHAPRGLMNAMDRGGLPAVANKIKQTPSRLQALLAHYGAKPVAEVGAYLRGGRPAYDKERALYGGTAGDEMVRQRAADMDPDAYERMLAEAVNPASNRLPSVTTVAQPVK
jgi:hypothetical protein